MDIIIRTSDGRVQTAASTITQSGPDYQLTLSDGEFAHIPANSYGYPTSLVQGVSGVPSDLAGGFNYNYVSGAFVSSGIPAPTPPAPPSGWALCQDIPSDIFISVAVAALTPAGYNRVKTDANSAWVFDALMSSSTVRPNYTDPTTNINLFQNSVDYLLATNAASDGQPLLTSANVTAIQSAWPK